jgi:BASS family bile acid:Na+ symporter
MQFTKALEVFAIVLVPVGLGLLVNQRYPNFSKKADRPVRIFSILILLMLVVSAVFQNRALFKENFVQLGAVVLVFNLASLAIGYGLPRALKLPKPQSIAIAMEIGIHNSTLAMALAVSVLLAAQLAAMVRFLADPKGRAVWYSAIGVGLYVTGMMIAAFALRP